MVESSMPLSAAVVAAPIRKLCPAYTLGSYPRAERADRTREVKASLDSGDELWNRKNGPGEGPRMARKAEIAATGQRSSPVMPRKMEMPFLP